LYLVSLVIWHMVSFRTKTNDRPYASSAKLPDVSPHDLRHRFGYRMAESVPLHRLAQIMGHDSLDTTKLYIQGTKHDLQQAVESIAWT
jgi:integrase/recombinase XerD